MIDMSGNCGNIAAGVGPFGIDEGIVTMQSGHSEVSKLHSKYTTKV